MAGIFKKGDLLLSGTTKSNVRILEFLGSGGQGEVYRVDTGGSELALKWYFEHTATDDQRNGISKLIEDGPPGQYFLWPMEMVLCPKMSSFGYLMPLRDKRYRSFLDLVTGRIDPTFETLMTVGLNLVDSFHKLHAAGLCYRDISFGNGFFDPVTGETLICDNDNVSPNNSKSKSVLGTPDFMAPEIVIRKAHPSRETDYFSLSVLLFYLFHIQHPLLGQKVLSIRSWDLPAREKLFGTEPVFIFDPSDTSNKAVDNPKVDPIGEAGKNAIPYWNNIYPTILKDAFVTSFTAGLRSPEKRLVASTWKKVLTNARNSIFRCTCGTEVFHDPKGSANKCWNCKKNTKPPLMLHTQHQQISASPGKRLFEIQLSEAFLDLGSPQIGEIVKHPKNPDVLGLRNLTKADWTAQQANEQKMVTIPPGKSVPILPGTIVNVGNHQIEFKSAI
jgi:serine/threonine protein kinase